MDAKKYHIALARPGFSAVLTAELQDRFGLTGRPLNPAAVALPEQAKLPRLDDTVFARQYLPLATAFKGEDLAQAAAFVLKRLEVMTKRANRQTGTWTLHAFALDDDPATHRAIQLEKAVLAGVRDKLSRLFKRYSAPVDFSKEPRSEGDILVQIYVPAPDELWLSITTLAAGVSVYVAGNRRMRSQDGAPSRSARKLEEAFVALGREPQAGETAVDLGAAPGGWTFALASHGADVTAVDHGELVLPDAKKLPGKIMHLKENGLKYLPPVPVDWLCCDMVIGPSETLRVLTGWLTARHMRHFVVNMKLPQADPWPLIKEALVLLQAGGWPVAKVKHLYHDRREVTLMGSLEVTGSGRPPA